jgi:putative transposase
MSTPQQPLIPGQYYHVFNKSVGGEFMFKTDENYRYFLEKYKKYVAPFAETLAYCLMPTHFHFLICPLDNDKSCEGFETLAALANKDTIPQADLGSINLSEKSYEGSKPLVGFDPQGFDLSRKFSHLFNAYAQAYNKQNKRSGSLFKNRFKRMLLTDDQHIRQVIMYIHLNPTHHSVESDFRNWKYSSYHAISGSGITLINRDKALEIFDDRENFVFCHNEKYEFDAGLYFDD